MYHNPKAPKKVQFAEQAKIDEANLSVEERIAIKLKELKSDYLDQGGNDQLVMAKIRRIE